MPSLPHRRGNGTKQSIKAALRSSPAESDAVRFQILLCLFVHEDVVFPERCRVRKKKMKPQSRKPIFYSYRRSALRRSLGVHASRCLPVETSRLGRGIL